MAFDDHAFSGTNLTCKRGHQIVFENISFDIKSSELAVLSGANGSGKTSLLRMMASLLPIEQGEIFWDEEDIEDYEDRSFLTWLSTDSPLKEELTVLENLRFWQSIYGCGRNDKTIKDALHLFEISHLSDLPVRYLSSGTIKRASLCRLALAEKPLWVLDEPLNHLDDKAQTILIRLIQEHVAKNGIAIIASHEPRKWSPHKIITLPFSPVFQDNVDPAETNIDAEAKT